VEELLELKKEIELIKERNKNVEADKAWEISLARKIVLAILTYISIGLYLSVIKVDRPWLNSIVPAVGFMLSTLTLGFFKRLWLKHILNKIRIN